MYYVDSPAALQMDGNLQCKIVQLVCNLMYTHYET